MNVWHVTLSRGLELVLLNLKPVPTYVGTGFALKGR